MPEMTLQEFFYRLGDFAGRRHEARPSAGVESEIILVRAEDEARAEQARRSAMDSGDTIARDTEQPKTAEPRIERYRDR